MNAPSLKALENLIVASGMGRRIGKTTALVEAANKIGATFVCADTAHSAMVKNEFKCKTVTNYADIRGTDGPYIWDHFAIELIANEAINDIKRLQKYIENLKQASDLLKRMSSDN